jgi:His/Glu/Gln/Arg/opine family amino acid ABC transporter permease subunit
MDLRFFEIYRSREYLLMLMEGAVFSIGLTLAAAVLGFLFALALSGVRFAQIPYIRNLATCYVEFIRNTPLIVQLFFVAFGLPLLLGYQWPGVAILCGLMPMPRHSPRLRDRVTDLPTAAKHNFPKLNIQIVQTGRNPNCQQFVRKQMCAP